MKIALLTDGITPYVTGGMQKHSFCLAKYLAQKGVHVDLYHDYGHLFPAEEVDALTVFSPEERKYITGIPFHFPAPGKLPGHYLRRSKKYSRILAEALLSRPMPDFIIAKGFTPWALLEKRSANLPPVAVKFHGMNMFQASTGFRGSLESAMFRPVVRKIMRQSDFVFSYGGKITEIIAAQGVKRDRILELPSGIEADWLDGNVIEHEEVRFLYVGRYERLKGIQELYSAVLMSPPELDFKLSFVGPIPDDQRLVHEKVQYYGQVADRMQLREIYKEHDILVSPSFSEGMPNAILEAMALSLSALSTNTGAVSALVTPQTGWLIESPPNPYDIRDAMVEIVQARELLQAKRHAAHSHVQANFMWPEIIGQLIAEMEVLVERKK